MKPVKTYEIKIEGYAPALYCARSPAKARARAWRDFAELRGASFRDFLVLSRLRRVGNPPGVGDRIWVGGRPAIRVLPMGGHRVWFMRDDSDIVVQTHPSELRLEPPHA